MGGCQIVDDIMHLEMNTILLQEGRRNEGVRLKRGRVSIDYSEETSLYNSATVYQSNVLITTERK